MKKKRVRKKKRIACEEKPNDERSFVDLASKAVRGILDIIDWSRLISVKFDVTGEDKFSGQIILQKKK